MSAKPEWIDPKLRESLLADDTFKRHVRRLSISLKAHSKDTICDFIVSNTRLRGQPFSFKGHEYQKVILDHPSPDKVIIKSAQMGISEMSVRLAISMCNLIPGFSVIYTLPSASAAQNFMKTRVDPVIQASPYLSEAVSKELDNTMIKRFGDSYLYLKGAQTDTQAISVPADMLIGDEVDNSNQGVMTLFESRLIHSVYQYKVKLSTPSIPNFGIDLLFKQSKRHMHLAKCTACNHWFEPDYHEHVRIPGFMAEVHDVAKSTFASPDFRWQEAYVACPKCGRRADLSDQHREWVCENPDDNFVSTGFRVSPFSCPEVISTASLVKASVEYERKQDFYNQRLGKALEDAESSLQEDELRSALINEPVATGGRNPRVMGLDMGTYCACTIAELLPDDTLVVIHTEMIPLFNVYTRRAELVKQFGVRMCVIDFAPYTETVYRIQQADQRVYAGVYVRSRGIDLYRVKDQEEDKEEGKEALRQISIVRDKVFDVLMDRVRDGKILKVRNKLRPELDDQWVKQLCDQKRVREFQGDVNIFVWKKTTGEDHYHHSLLYTYIAAKIMALSINTTPLPSLVSRFKVTNQRL